MPETATGITAAQIAVYADIITFEACNEGAGIVSMRAARRAAERVVAAAQPLIAAAERERITGRFNEWIDILMAEPNAWPPDAWKAAFASLVDPEWPGKLARNQS